MQPVVVFALITDLATGGAQQTLLTLAAGLDRTRFALTALCLMNGDGRVGDALRAQGIRVIDLHARNGGTLPPVRRLFLLLRRERPAILHGWLFHSNMLARLVGRAAGVPVVISSRHSIDIGGERRERVQAATAWMDDAVVTIGAAVREAEISRSGARPDKVHTIYNSVRIADFVDLSGGRRRRTREALGLADDTFVVGSVGRLHPVKGHDVLIEAFAQVHRRHSNALLLLAGDGVLRATLEQRVAALGLVDAVRFLGDRRDVPDLLAAFDLFVLASRWEGIPVVVLEAMAAGTPVVATAAGGTTEVVTDGVNGLLASVDDAAALAAALLRAIEDEALRTNLVRAAAAQVRSRFSADKSVAQYEALYSGLLRGKGIAVPPPASVGSEHNTGEAGANRSRARVLHPITRLIVGGAQENTMLTAALLDKRTWAVEVVSGTQIGSEGSLIEAVRERGVPLHLEPSLVREVNPVQDALALLRLTQLMRRGRYDVVHTHSSKAGILGRWAAKLAGVPVIVHTVHGWGHHERQHPLVRAYYILLEKASLPVTDKLIVVSPLNIGKGLADNIGRPQDYIVIRSGIELERFGHPAVPRAETRKVWGIPPDAVVVGSVTRLSAQKAPLDFVRAAARMRSEWEQGGAEGRAPLWFLVVGDGDLRADVEALARQLGVSDRLVLTGLRRDVPELLAAMDIFVLSSLWEGLPRVLPQAMATGLPIVATAADGTAEAVSPGVNGFLAPPGDPDALAGLVLQLLYKPALAQKMGTAGLARVEEFSDRRMVALIDDLYRTLLARKGILLPLSGASPGV